MKIHNWDVYGLTIAKSDSTYQTIADAIKSGNVNQKHLQKVTGHRLPIDVNVTLHTIDFSSKL